MSEVSGMYEVSDMRPVEGMGPVMDRTDTAELVIQDPDACEMAEALMRLTGQGLEAVVVTALRHAVEQAERRAQYHEQIMAITRDIAAGSRGV